MKRLPERHRPTAGTYRYDLNPLNSPDLNILDLGLFAASQARQLRKPAKSIDDMVANIEAASNDIEWQTIGD